VHVFTADSDPQEIERAIEAGEPFWLDVPSDRFSADQPAARALGLDEHRLARLRTRAGRAIAIVEEDYAAIVFSGAQLTGAGVERLPVMIFESNAALLTLRERPCPPLDALHDSPLDIDAVRILDALTDSLHEAAEQMDDQVDQAENVILQSRSGKTLPHLTELRQQLSDLLRIARDQSGMVARSQDELRRVPVRFGTGDRRIRDLEGHLARVVFLAESARQTIAETLNLYLSLAAENLTQIATFLLPLTVVSGFFGMNFGWMVGRIDTMWSFIVFGVGGMVASVAGVRLYLARKGYG
jgi:magnesium transporter